MSSDGVLPARLHARVVQVRSAMTGATGVHLLRWDDDWHGWLRPAPDGDGGTVPVGGTGREAAAPMSVLRYVQRTREPLVVADAARDDRFAPDPYFAAVTCCSLLAVPIRRLLVADFAILVRYDGPREAITIIGTWTSTGAPAPTPVGGQLPLGGQNVTTLVYRTGRPARVDYDDAISGASGQIATHDWGLRSSVGVPISIESRLWGVMVVAFTREESLPADTEARLTGFTELVATAVANAQAQAELAASRARIVAVDDAARRRIQRNLHDGAQQRLVTLSLGLQEAQAAVPGLRVLVPGREADGVRDAVNGANLTDH